MTTQEQLRALAELLEKRKTEPSELMRQDHPQALAVAVSRANVIDRQIAEWVEEHLPALLGHTAALEADLAEVRAALAKLIIQRDDLLERAR